MTQASRRSPVTRRQFLEGAGAALVMASRGNLAFAQGGPRAGPADWPRFGYDLHNTRHNARESILGRDNVSRLKPKWTFQAEAPIQTTPTVIGDTLFFGSHDGSQYALESATGRLKWRYQAEPLPNRVRSSCHYVDGRIYFGDNYTQVRCLDAATGREIWRTRLSDRRGMQMFCSVAVHDGKVLTGFSSNMESGEVACLDAETGAVRWSFRVVPGSQYGGGSVWTSPAIDERYNIVYNVTGSVKGFMPAGPMLYTESILAHDLNSGELLWYQQVRPGDPFDLDFGSHPMIFDAHAPAGYRGDEIRKCVAAGNKGGMFCWNRYTGELYWKTMLYKADQIGGPELNSTAVVGSRILLVSNARNLKGNMSISAGLNAYNGDIEWWSPNNALVWGPVAAANGVFYQGLDDGSLEALDAEDGRTLWRYQLPTIYRGGTAIANGALYTSNGAPMTDWTPEEVRSHDYFVFAFTVDGE